MSRGLSSKIKQLYCGHFQMSGDGCFDNLIWGEYRCAVFFKSEGNKIIDDSGSFSLDSTWFTFEKMLSREEEFVWLTDGLMTPTQKQIEAILPLLKSCVSIINLGGDDIFLNQSFSSKVKLFFNPENMEEAANFCSKLRNGATTFIYSPASKQRSWYKNYKQASRNFREQMKTAFL